MQGGVGKNDDDDSPGALTSYILIAMLEAGANKTVSIISSLYLSSNYLYLHNNHSLLESAPDVALQAVINKSHTCSALCLVLPGLAVTGHLP